MTPIPIKTRFPKGPRMWGPWWKEYPRCRDRLPLKPEDHTDPLWFFLDDRAQQNDYFE